ncbi:MAG TPA: J domain-containing protein [Polyangia bacterium]
MAVATRDEISGLGLKGDKPRLNPRLDFTQLKLTPTEGFILSRIDGRASYDEVCRMSSLGREETLAILRKLKTEKVILGPHKTAPAPSPRGTQRSLRSPSPDYHPKTPPPVVVTDAMLRQARERAGGKADENPIAQVSVLERLDDGGPVDPDDLVEGPDLSDETKKRIIRLHRRMRKLLPHELLGVAKDADSAAIKRAFGAASKELHPDRYFGKNLGCFREKLAKIFNRITEAVQELEKARKAKK